MIADLVVAQSSLPQGFEFHLAPADAPGQALCGATVQPTQIPPLFWAVDSAIEGRWCGRCETLSRRPPPPVEASEPGYAPCV